MSPWHLRLALPVRGGRVLARREDAPLGRVLPYRRAAGEGPAARGQLADEVARRGWRVDLGDRGLGDTLLGLALAQGLAQACAGQGRRAGVVYQGPRAGLMRRCSLVTSVAERAGPHVLVSSAGDPECFTAAPERPPTWLDVLDEDQVEVHAALPMRYYLELEQVLGVRLPADRAPAPGFATSVSAATPFHVVFVTATSWPARKDYGLAGFAAVAKALAVCVAADWSFTIIAPAAAGSGFGGLPHRVLRGLDASDCLDVFGSAELVVGNDTGLTHLAALCARVDGSGPQVVALHSRHAPTKWTTGSARHHAVATRFAQMMAAADACPVRDGIDDTAWRQASEIATIPADLVARFAGQHAGWW